MTADNEQAKAVEEAAGRLDALFKELSASGAPRPSDPDNTSIVWAIAKASEKLIAAREELYRRRGMRR